MIKSEKKRYILLNKPKGFLTTMDDPRARKTVMDLVGNATKERIFPVGRLDRATTGVLLFTNDGDLAKRLTHPSHGADKIYHAVLDKPLLKADFDKLAAGITLQDGPVPVDEISYVDENPREIGLRIHIGRNRIVRRMFEHLGYTVEKLDRVSFAGLTKKSLSRGQYRSLTDQEVRFLKTR
jgi:23S rRNA pseudouridine2605 synthase